MIGGTNPTPQPVTGQFPIVGVWQSGLIVERDGALRAVGPSPAHHNLYSLKARLLQGEPLHVVAERVELRGHTLRWLLSRIDQSRPYYLLGEVEMPDGRGPALTGRLDSVDTYNPASYRGGILRLHYARAQELEPWLDLVAVRGEVVVQFWLKPGEAAVTLGPGEEQEVERIPEQLRRFLGSSPKRAKSMVRACPPRTNSRVISLYLWDTKLPFDKEHRPLASALLFASTGFDGGTQTGLLQQPLVGASTTTIRGELCTLE